MSPRKSDARQRVVTTAARMLAQHGLNATSIREMAKRADAPLGSTYHHFPKGKHELVIEAVQFAGDQVSEGLDKALAAGGTAGIERFIRGWRNILIGSDFHVGCPVMAVAVEEPMDGMAEDLLQATARVFDDWKQKLVRSLVERGRDDVTASQLATLIVASLEGALVLCRAHRNIQPFDEVASQLNGLLAADDGHHHLRSS